jgi:transcriptional regulator with XRE-family HTH domain
VEIEGMSSLVGDRIKERRLECGWTRAQLSRLSSIPVRTIERIETGVTPRPRDDTLQILADALNIDVHELIELRDREASDISQVVTIAANNDSTVFTPASGSVTLSDATEPADPVHEEQEPNRRHRSKRVVYYSVSICVVVAIIFVLTHSLWASGSLTKPVIITGTVLCLNNGPVVNVWYDVLKDGRIDKSLSGYANLGITARNGLQMAFAFTLRGDAYILHVGCGGSWQHWKSTYSTETHPGPMYDHKAHFFTCHNAPNTSNYGPCDLKY